MSTVTYPHIDFRKDGTPIVAGTRTKVIEVVLDRIAYNWDADEIQKQHPYLSLSQIHAAFTYYYDHQEEMDRAIAEQLKNIEYYKKKMGPSPLRAKLKAMGLLP